MQHLYDQTPWSRVIEVIVSSKWSILADLLSPTFEGNVLPKQTKNKKPKCYFFGAYCKILNKFHILCICFDTGIHEKCSVDVVSAVCYILYSIYLCLSTQTVETTSPESFLWIPLYLSNISHDFSKEYITMLKCLWYLCNSTFAWFLTS